MSQIPTIFVVDDDDVVRDSLKVLLEARRFAVRDFESAGAFLAHRRASPAAGCLILDVHMPKMGGIELLQTLRTGGDDLPVILMTGRPDAAARNQARALGVLAFLDKPIAHPALFAAIDQVVKPR